MSRIVIGISAKAQCGKSTIADHLVRYYGFRRDAFADPLKRACSVLFNVPMEQLESQEGKMLVNEFMGCTNRAILQVFGTELIRQHLEESFVKMLGSAPEVTQNGMFWVNHFLYRNKDADDRIVVPDVRFENEAVAIRFHDGRVLRHDRKGWTPDPEVNKHDSETDLDEFTAFDWRASTGTVRDMLDFVDNAMHFHGIDRVA